MVAITNIKRDKGRIYLRPTAVQKRQGKTLIRLWAEEGTETFRKEYEQAVSSTVAGDYRRNRNRAFCLSYYANRPSVHF
jgi:hypothetical protein